MDHVFTFDEIQHLKQIRRVQRLDKWVPCEWTKNKKLIVLKCYLLSFYAIKQTISWSDCDVRQKVDCIWQPEMTSSVDGLRRDSKGLPKAKLSPKKCHGRCLVVCPILSRTAPDCMWHNQGFKRWMNWATQFCLVCRIHLTSCQPTIASSSIWKTFGRENASITSRRQKMLSKSSLNTKA